MALRRITDKIIEKSLITIMAVMVVNVLWQVFTRYIMGNPSSFTDELARYLMIWIGVLGAAYVSGKRLHVSIDFLPSKCSVKTQKKLAKVVSLIIIIFSTTALIVGGGRLVYVSFILGQQSPALQIPLALVYLALPISGVLIVFYKVSDILNKEL